MQISVYITSYNQREFLIEAIESVLNQTLKPHQIIVVDDASQDGSQEVIAGYVSRYPDLFTAIYHEQNTGVTQTRIDALRAVTGDYVTYVDGDDRYLPTKLEKEAQALRDSAKATIAFSGNYYMTNDGKTRLYIWPGEEIPPQGNVFQETYTRLFPKRSLFRMELVDYAAWKSVGFHDPAINVYEDYDMRIRLTKQLEVVYYPEPLTEIRINDNGLSHTHASIQADALYYIQMKNRDLLRDYPPDVQKAILKQAEKWRSYTEKRAIYQNPPLQKSLIYYKRAFPHHSLRTNVQLLLLIIRNQIIPRNR